MEKNCSRLKADAGKSWNIFYRRNKDNFFRDRHWCIFEFPELLRLGLEFGLEIPENRRETADPDASILAWREGDAPLTLFEVGCGAGNFIFPLLKRIPALRVIACDISPEAVELVKRHPDFDPCKCKVFVSDISSKIIESNIVTEEEKSVCGYEEKSVCGFEEKSVCGFGLCDILSMIFVLSAVAPDDMSQTINRLAKFTKPGGVILFRDYGEGDHAQKRFSASACLSPETSNWFVRKDNTFSYFFTLEQVRTLFEESGLWKCHELKYVYREVINRKTGNQFKRVFVQARIMRKQ